MIRSMTGFARVVGTRKKGGWSVEIRSLNHRFFELSLKTPPSLYGLEDRIREFCQSRIRRGKVTVNVMEMENSAAEEVTLDEKALRFYLAAIRKLQRRFALKGSPSISELLTLPQIFSVKKKREAPSETWSSLKPYLEKALNRLLSARIQEGKALARDLLGRIHLIEKKLLAIERRARSLPREYYEKLRQRMRELLEDRVTEDKRVWQSAALLAEKTDTTEEIVRLKSHLRLFREKAAHQEEVGRELDFLLQEMNREVNTISAKAQDFGISKEVIFIKAEIEKIREQIQNIE